MCGIAGVVSARSEGEGLARVRAMNAAQAHRGPDEEGTWVRDRIALGVRRLSIIDLAGGHQPMHSEDRDVAVAFNGEIYNYRDLRRELAAAGYPFRTQSDTEVVLALYASEGLRGVRRLAGMFGIAIYDGRLRQLHLVRDRLGVKPLYYRLDGPRLTFASEIKALLAGLDGTPRLDRQAIHHYLTLRFVPGPDSIWHGIRKLPPAHSFTLDLQLGHGSETRFWEAPFVSDAPDDDRDYLAEFTDLFSAAVEKRLVAADVPVGVLLSGGLDSSAVSAAAVETGHRAFHTFSVGFDDPEAFDELPYASEVSRALGSVHHEVRLDRQEFMDLLPTMVEATDEPLADLASVPLFAVSRLASEHVKVVLSGEGSDEVLAGYDLDSIAKSVDSLGMLGRLPPRLLSALGNVLPPQRGGRVRALGHGGRSRMMSHEPFHMTNVWSENEKRQLWRWEPPGDRTDDLIRSWYAACPSDEPIDQIQQVYCAQWLVEDLLMKADKMSMATSLELRTPFLDHALVEWAARLPLSLKVGTASTGYESKRILRQYATSRLPASIVRRPKQGFPVPAERWLRGEQGVWAERLITDPQGKLAELFERRTMRDVARRAQSGDAAAGRQTWTLVVLYHWLERWT